ncbi:MAG: hypothetical protein A2020_10955 [Lentisphaerae bacterium GWF2_45_14]|nr:MAG: hypothetical protein A2020_10955 [Lentisphaerae bacterium GWF2_45_14]
MIHSSPSSRYGSSEAVLDICVRFLKDREKKGTTIDDFVDFEFSSEDSPPVRRTVSSILFTYFRNKALIDALIDSSARGGSVKPGLKAVLQITLCQALFQDGIAPESAANVAVDYVKKHLGKPQAGFVNALMRKLIFGDIGPFKEKLPVYTKLNLPEVLYNRWFKTFEDKELLRLCNLMRRSSAATFRALRPLSDEIIEKTSSIKLKLPEWAGNLEFYECGNFQALLESELLEKGLIYVQDPSTALAPMMPELKEADKVLDLCAAPGGKSIIIAGRQKNLEMTAMDSSPRRQQLTQENFKNTKLNASVIVGDATKAPFLSDSFDLVLADVPCSNTGVFRRRPDVPWNFSEKKLDALTRLQARILESSLRLCRPGGQIVYSTCSLEPEENSQMTSKFAKSFEGRVMLEKEVQLMPSATHDGSYAAILRKSSSQ